MIKATFALRPEALRAARRRLQGAAERVHNHRVTIGLHEDQADVAKKNYKGQATKADMILVAAVHEFGAGAVPSRSWLRDWFDQFRSDLERRMIQAMRDEYKEYATGLSRSPAMVEFARAGLVELLNRIKAGIMPPLTPRTAQERLAAGLDADPPLLATSQFTKSLAAKVDGVAI